MEKKDGKDSQQGISSVKTYNICLLMFVSLYVLSFLQWI